jgi:SAM-dependent methyltransferase
MDLQETGKLLYRSQPDVFADAAYLPFAKQSFDTVLLFEVLEHVSQPTQALQGIRRVLKTNGRVIITIPFLYPMHDEPYDFQRYTLYGLERELASAGLQVEIIKPILGTACSGGLLLSLAISGMVLRAIQGRRLVALLAPLILIIIPSINLCAWILDKILPSWPALTAGFFVVGTKP